MHQNLHILTCFISLTFSCKMSQCQLPDLEQDISILQSQLLVSVC